MLSASINTGRQVSVKNSFAVPDDFQQRYDTLKRSLADIGYFRRGSLVRRFTLCGKAGCACQASPPSPHGPYFQWTRKVRGKTVTVRLTREQATELARWIEAGRELDRVIGAMEKLSLRATERALQALPAAARRRGVAGGRGKSANAG